jgi:hypothetical protein
MPIKMRAVKLYLCADEDMNVSCALLYFLITRSLPDSVDF